MNPLTESQFQDRIITYARLRGWMVSHIQNVTMTGRGGRIIRQTPAAPGFPDLTLARGGQVWFLEVKSETGAVSPVQREWLAALAGVSPDEDWSGRSIPDHTPCENARRVVMVVRPRHWDWLLEALK